VLTPSSPRIAATGVTLGAACGVEDSTMNAFAFLARLDANVDAFYRDAITFAEFGRRNRAIWSDVDAAGPRVRADVDAVLRSRP